MDLFLKFLIHAIYTIDGVKGSARDIVGLQKEILLYRYQKECEKSIVSKYVDKEISLKAEHKIFRKIYLKYLIIRV